MIIRYIEKGNEWRFSGGNVMDFAGNFQHKLHNSLYVLFELDEFDKNFVENVKLKPNEKIFRFETERAKTARMKPLIKINLVKGLVYFLEEKAETPIFETVGLKVNFLNLVQK